MPTSLPRGDFLAQLQQYLDVYVMNAPLQASAKRLFSRRSRLVGPFAALIALGGFLYPFYLLAYKQEPPATRTSKARGAFINSGSSAADAAKRCLTHLSREQGRRSRSHRR